MLRIVTLVISSCLLLSCGKLNIKPETSHQLKVKENIAEVVRVDYPLWIDDPRLVNHIGATGSAEIEKFRSKQLQFWSAMKNAQVNLNLAYMKQQQTLMLNKKKTISLANEGKIDLSAKELLFHNAIVNDEWTDPETGKFYLWLVLPLGQTDN